MPPPMPMQRFKPAIKSSEWLQSGSTAALRKSQNIRERTFFINFSTLAAPGVAGVAGLEPATPGFGDRCSTN
jgi:hypothetical protein